MHTKLAITLAFAGTLLTTVAAAQSVQYQPGYKPGDENTPEAADLTLGVAELFAVVHGNGTLIRGAGAVSSTRFGTGQYQAVFTRNVRNCAYVGSISEPTNTLIPPAGQIAVTGRSGNDAGIFVQTRDGAGAAADRTFMVKVSCVR